MSLAVPLAYFLKLDRRFADGALGMREPAASATLAEGHLRLTESLDRIFMMQSIPLTLSRPAEFVDFEQRPSVLESLA